MTNYFRFKKSIMPRSRALVVSLPVLVCICTVLVACSPLSTREPESDDTAAPRYARSGDLKAEVDSLAKPLIDDGTTPGMVVGVLLPSGERQIFGYGVTARDTTGVTPDGNTIFPVGSLSKGFLGALTALLVSDGVLSWDDTLPELLPPGTSLSPDAQKITLLQLATHTSGLPRQPMTLQTLYYFIRYLFTGRSFYAHLDEEYVLDYLSKFKAPKKPDFQYSNIGYGVLGRIIELRTGVGLETLMQQKILLPLKLKNTGYDPEKISPRLVRAHGYAGDQPKFIRRGKAVPDWTFTDIIRGGAAMYSNADDLLTFAEAHLNSAMPMNAILADTLNIRFPGREISHAIAWNVEDTDDQRITYQVGLVAGYTAYLGLDTKQRTAVVVLQNSFNWQDRVGHILLTRLYRAEKLRQAE
jgi:CubicO group peptidase (beta-lactamase class C family)